MPNVERIPVLPRYRWGRVKKGLDGLIEYMTMSSKLSADLTKLDPPTVEFEDYTYLLEKLVDIRGQFKHFIDNEEW